MPSVFTGELQWGDPFFLLDWELMRVVQSKRQLAVSRTWATKLVVLHITTIHFWSASILCAFSDNVPEILRNVTRAWMSGNATPSGRPRHGCLLAAAAAPALPTCSGRQAVLLVLTVTEPISEVVSGALVLPCAVLIPVCRCCIGRIYWGTLSWLLVWWTVCALAGL